MPDPTAPALAPAVRETHVSTIFLVGDRAAKLKKAVSFPFIDLSTREARERICHREVELNRRLAPDVYLGVYDIVDPDGEPTDHLVMMRRMPDDRRLAALVVARTAPLGAMRDLAHLLASFHLRAATSDEISSAGSRDAISHRWEQGFAEIGPILSTAHARSLEDDIEHAARRYLAGRERLFAARQAQGRIRDGHGDLLADDVFLLDDGPRVLDCLEFDDELRYGDVLADTAFLAMDLERLGAPDSAVELLAAHREDAGDSYPATLAHHYIAMRAHIRAKVAALRAGQVGGSAGAEVDALLSLTAAHLRCGRVTLTLVGGAPGTGKSTLAAGIADARRWTILRSDEVRKDLLGIDHLEPSSSGLDVGTYSERHTRRTYEELLDRARSLLELGEPVVLDASWANETFRTLARELAATASADLVELRCVVDPDTAARRISARLRTATDPSDATPEIAETIRHRFDPWPDAVPIDTRRSPGEALTTALAAIDATMPERIAP